MRNLIISLSLLLLLPLLWGVECMAETTQKRVVVLDAGHGNPRPGKVQNKVREADYVLEVTKLVKKQLSTRAKELDVYLTRSCDSSYHATQSVDNKMRAEFANKRGADLYVGIHANAHHKPTVNGCEVWVLTLNEKLMTQNDNVAARYADEGDFIDAKDLDRSSMGFMMALARQLDNEPYMFSNMNRILLSLCLMMIRSSSIRHWRPSPGRFCLIEALELWKSTRLWDVRQNRFSVMQVFLRLLY